MLIYCLLETKLHANFDYDIKFLQKLQIFNTKDQVSNFGYGPGGKILLKWDPSKLFFKQEIMTNQFIHDVVSLNCSTTIALTYLLIRIPSIYIQEPGLCDRSSYIRNKGKIIIRSALTSRNIQSFVRGKYGYPPFGNNDYLLTCIYVLLFGVFERIN